MRYYLVLPRCDVAHADSYWVLASSGEEARRLVAPNVPGASRAAEDGDFECVVNDQRQPPPDFIYTQINRIYVARQQRFGERPRASGPDPAAV